MHKRFIYLLALLSITAFAGESNFPSGIKTPYVNFNSNAKILASSADPTLSATNGLKGSLYLMSGASGGKLYVKQDDGTTTNWTCANCGGGGGGDIYNGGQSGPVTIGTNNATSFVIETNNVARLAFDSNGNLGVGSSPQSDSSSTNKNFFYTSSDGSGVNKNLTGLFAQTNLTNTSDGSGYQQGLYAVVHSNANTGLYALLRNYLMAESSGDGTITETYGMRGLTRIFDANYPSDISTGTIVNGYGGEFYAHSTSPTATMKHATGILVSSARAGNTAGTGSDSEAHTAYGIRILNDITATGSAIMNRALAILSEATAPSEFNGEMRLNSHAALRLSDNSDHYITVNAPTSIAGSIDLTLPPTTGTDGQCVKTNGSGALSFGDCGGGGGGGNVNYGGDAFASTQTLGSTNAFDLGLVTNGTTRMTVASTGAVTIGGTLGDFGSQPTRLGIYSFGTTDTNRPVNSFENYYGYYGNTSQSRNGTQFSFYLRPGETTHTYSGEYNVFIAQGGVNAAGNVGTLVSFKGQTSVLNGSAVLSYGTGADFSAIAPSGVLKHATGLNVSQVQARGTDDSDHDAVGIRIGEVSASGSSGQNLAVGISIQNNITGGSTFAIKSDSTAQSVFHGDVEIDDSAKGFIISAPNGTRYRITVSNIGVLAASPL